MPFHLVAASFAGIENQRDPVLTRKLPHEIERVMAPRLEHLFGQTGSIIVLLRVIGRLRRPTGGQRSRGRVVGGRWRHAPIGGFVVSHRGRYPQPFGRREPLKSGSPDWFPFGALASVRDAGGLDPA